MRLIRKLGGCVLVTAIAFCFASCFESSARPDAAPRWNSYQVYQPVVTRSTVIDPNQSDLKYNHCSTIAFFNNRWFCLWNANTEYAESQPGQTIYMSTSPDGKEWSAPESAFKSHDRSVNPIPCKMVQWQPALIVHENELWCFWGQWSRDEFYGAYFSRLNAADGRWTNRRLLWDGSPDAGFDGKKWRIFPSQNPVRLSSGRYLAPVVLIGPEMTNAPVKSWWSNEKRASVLYSDDAGATWHYSEGTSLPERLWTSWEPTVWEKPDGKVAMFCRNNDQRKKSQGGPDGAEVLLYAESSDGGITWGPLEYVPIQTVVSRMHVIRQNQNWAKRPAADERFIMVHNAWPNQNPLFVRDRNAISLFSNRGGGQNFVTGPNISGSQTVVSYPHMAVHSNDLFVSYTRGTGNAAIFVTRVSPLPDPDQFYLFPRTLPYPAAAAPECSETAVRFHGTQYFDFKEQMNSNSVFNFGAWIFPELEGTVLDMQTPSGRTGPRFEFMHGRLGVTLPGRKRVDAPDRPLPIYEKNGWMPAHMWYYLGVTVDCKNGLMNFYVNQAHTGQVKFDPVDLPKESWRVRIGANQPGSKGSLNGFTGDLRFAALWCGAEGQEYHARLYEQLALQNPAAQVLSAGSLVFDVSDLSWKSRVTIPPREKYGTVETVAVDGVEALLVYGAAGAGIETPVWNPASGETLECKFRFKVMEGSEAVILTAGDLKSTLQIVRKDESLMIRSGSQEQPVLCNLQGWVDLTVKVCADAVTVQAGEKGAPVTVAFRSQLNTLYLGDGFVCPAAAPKSGVAFDVKSLRTRVIKRTAP
ncbi:MAG: sialidase family protein [Kiritimatiellales bacterium]